MIDSLALQSRSSAPALDVSNLRIPPHSIEAEQGLIGALLLDNQAWERIAEIVSADDFYRHEHRLIFGAMALLSENSVPLDPITVSERLNTTAELDSAGGLAYIGDIVRNTPSAANVQAYALIVRERSTLRQLISAAGDIAARSFSPDGSSGEEVLDEAERRVMEISERRAKRGGPQGVNALLTGVVEHIDELYASKNDITGLSTGYIDLDKQTSGLQRADLVIVAGRPSMGKTAFAMNLVEHAVLKQDKPVLVFSMEMPASSLIVRMLSSIGRIDQQRLRNGQLLSEDWPRLSHAVTALKDRPLFIDDTPALSPTELRTRARRLRREHGDIAMIMVDYLQLMQVPGARNEGRVNEVSEISRNLKAMAKEFNCPVIALSQLNRSLEQRPNKRPVMSDLRESGSIEQDADVIAFIYRDEVYREDSPDKGVAEIIIGKQRNGPIGIVRLAFQKEFTRFENLMHGSYNYSGD